ncbi:N4-gp56 family major capsid protein [Streptomyces sp. NPDC045456]|uniref:N4-gp56 family major capsid protein n=1 Tax=Streptomyces sp. NPDC045456 TaxID=3155254 RepID=UPI0034100E0A
MTWPRSQRVTKTVEQFAVKKTELGVAPGLTINFMRYNNLEGAKQLVEGVRMETQALSASQFSITVAEHGAAVAVSEMLLNASFDDVMASASRLLGRNMAMYLDGQCRSVLLGATSVIYGYDKFGNNAVSTDGKPGNPITRLSPYDKGVPATGRDALTEHYLTSAVIKDGVETLASKNIPRLGDTYVCFIHPHQSRWLREDPSWIESTKYAAPGNFSIGEVGRIDDVIFVESTQVRPITNSTNKKVYQATMIGDNSYGHAISLPVELRDGGVLDFGREHALAWYSVYGMGMVTDQSVVTLETN